MIKFLPILLAAMTAITTSCEKGSDETGDGRNTGFSVPALTDENSIRLTVDALAGYSVSMVMYGGRIAADWGDGSPMTKDIHPEEGDDDLAISQRTEFRHTYKKAGEYTVRIWSEEVTFIYHPGGDAEFGELCMGNCPVLKSVWLYHFPEVTTLDMGGCPALEDFHLGYCARLESIELGKCPELQTASVFNTPLKMLDLSANGKLTELDCSHNALEKLKLPESIEFVNCSGNNLASFEAENLSRLWAFYCNDNKKLTSLNLAGSDLHVIGFSNTAVETFDFPAFSNLSGVECNNTRLGSVDVSSNERLSSLFCSGARLNSLDVTGNPKLYTLDCSDNALTSLDVSQNPALFFLNIADNGLVKEELNAVFTGLPLRSAVTRMPSPLIKAAITIWGNPGTAGCNTELATGKGWHLATPKY